MSELLTDAPTAAGMPLASESTPATGAPPGALGRKKFGVLFWLALGWIGVLVILAFVAGLLPIPDPDAVGVALPGQGPSWHHLLGTDDLGRDLFSRVIFGSRVSLAVGFFSIVFGLILGGALGLVAGFYRGAADAIVTAISNILLAFPALVALIAVVSFWGPTLFHITLAIGVLSMAPLAIVVRGNTIRFAQREFVLAARMLGAKNGRIIRRELLANVIPSALALGLVAVPVAIVAEGALSFLGLSVRLPTPTWGNMIAEGRVIMTVHPLVAFWPSLFLFITVLGLNIVGDRLQSYFDVREGGV